MTKLSETLCPKTGSNASNYIQITFFTTKSIQTAKSRHRYECIGNNLNHFAGLFLSSLARYFHISNSFFQAEPV